MRRAAYQGCCRMRDADGRTFDYAHEAERHGHLQTIILAPSGSPLWVKNPHDLWSRAAAAERRADAQEARTIELSIPRELPRHLYADFAREMAAPFVSEGMIVQIDIQVTPASDGGLNSHIHMIVTMRRIVDDEFSPKKEREWNALFYGQAKKLRIEIANVQNAFCRERNIDFHADPRANCDRHLPPPLPTIPRWNILVAKRRGRKTKWMEQLEQERASRAALALLEADLCALEARIRQELTWQLFPATRAGPFSERISDAQAFMNSRCSNSAASGAGGRRAPQIQLAQAGQSSAQSAPHPKTAPCEEDVFGHFCP
jgi:hypothetical protein